ncbi:MAG: CcmD family protein [Bacteroidota bacterium]
MKKYLTTIFAALFFLTHQVAAQTEDVDFMHARGKIYVVIAVIAAIFVGIILFLVYLERKLTKLESLIED